MNKIFTLLILVFSFSSLIAQNDIIIANEVLVFETSENTFSEEESVTTYIINNSDEAKTIVWNLVETSAVDGWAYTVCTGQSCYPPGTYTQQFTVNPNDSMLITVHCNSNEICGEGAIEFTAALSSNPDEILATGAYTFENCADSSVDIYIEDLYMGFSTSQQTFGEEEFVTTYVVNNTSETQIIRWNLVETTPVSGWTYGVCTGESCYPPGTYTQNFGVDAGESYLITIHCYTDDICGEGEIKFNISLESAQDDILSEAEYNFTNCSTSINEIGDFTKFELYPNPAKEYFSIDNYEDIKSIKIFNILGAKMKNPEINPSINISNLPKGLYIVEIADNFNKIYSYKLQKI